MPIDVRLSRAAERGAQRGRTGKPVELDLQLGIVGEGERTTTTYDKLDRMLSVTLPPR